MMAFIARQIRRLIALMALAAMLIGAPYALYKLGLPLLPDHVPGLGEIWQRLTERDTGQVFLGFLVIVGFVAWAIFAITVLMEVASRIAHRPDWHLPGLHLPQAAAGVLVGMLIAGTIATSAAPAIAANLPLLPRPAPAAVTSVAASFHAASPTARHDQAGMTAHPAAPTHTARPAATAGPTWTVSKGDSLWSIAEKTLGSGRRYHEIAALNQGRTQPDGRTLESANFLLPGWILHLPTDARLPVGASGTAADQGAAAQAGDERPAGETVVVEPGDTLSQIALNGLGDAALYPQIAAANHIANPDLIYPGQPIRIAVPDGKGGGVSPGAHNQVGAGPRRGDSTPHHDHTSANPQSGSDVDRASGPGNRAAANGGSRADATAGRASDRRAEAILANTAGAPNNKHTESELEHQPAVDAEANPVLAAPKAVGSTASASTMSQRTMTLGGATALAAALAWAGLLAVRRRLARRRLPGQRPASLTVEEAQIERSIHESATAAAPQRLNAALRSVTGPLAAHAPSGVDLVLIGDEAIELHPRIPAPPPEPFTGTETVWLLDLPEDAELKGAETLSALPALVTLGTLDDGRLVAVDIEHLGALSISGDPDRCGNLVNHIILELSQSPWMDGIHVSVHGVSDSVCALDGDRIQAIEDLQAATQFMRYQVEHTRKVLGDEPIAHARTETTYSDAWEPHIVIANSGALAEMRGIGELIEALEHGPAAAAAVIACGDRVDIQTRVTVDAAGALQLPKLGNIGGITAASVTNAEFAAIVGLFSQTNVDDLSADEPCVTAPTDRNNPGDETAENAARGESQPADQIGSHAAGAPQTLDADLAEWFSDNPSRPRIAILGDAHVDGLGVLRDRPIARMTEYAVYLALHPAGVSADKFVTDLWPENRQPSDSTRRADVSRLRAWLGMRAPNDPFLPTMSGRYQLVDRLVDAELFARLRARAKSHAQHGDAHAAMVDYQSALRLVRGPVLPEASGPGYTWLSNTDRMEDRILPTQIVDAAHALVDIALTVGTAIEAEAAAATGRTADPYSIIPLCDMVRIALAQGDRETARAWADLMLTLNGVDLPADLPAPCGDIVADLYRAPIRSTPARAAP